MAELSSDNKKFSASILRQPEVGIASCKQNLTSKVSMKKVKQCDKTAAASRPHFRIDWRQLTYYHHEPKSLLSSFKRNNNEKKKNNKNNSELLTSGSSNQLNLADQAECGRHLLNQPADFNSKSSGNRKRILNSLDGCFKSGELSAILGPSGAGKSTFLSALFGEKQESSYGQTRVTWLNSNSNSNSKATCPRKQTVELNDELEVVDKQRTVRIAFLPQHDHLLNHLSVYETLLFASKIKNPSQRGNKTFHRLNVKRVAKMLKLTDCFETRCGQLSGGQYKRVSIGQELLSEPDVIILDEPTSGLDAMTCLTTIRTLKSIATKQPISIILTIHQPDIDVFNLFDRVYVIAQGGLAIYEGPPQEVASTLARVNLFMPSESYNPARFLVENAFVADLEDSAMAANNGGGGGLNNNNNNIPGALIPVGSPVKSNCKNSLNALSSSSEDDESDAEESEDEDEANLNQSNFIKRSISSITEALSGKLELKSNNNNQEQQRVNNNNKQFRDSGRRPLLNIGIQTADGRLITSDVLMMERQQNQLNELRAKELASRLNLLKRLNELQKEKYYPRATSDSSSPVGTMSPVLPSSGGGGGGAASDLCSASYLSSEALSQNDDSTAATSGDEEPPLKHSNNQRASSSSSSVSIASSSYSEARDVTGPGEETLNQQQMKLKQQQQQDDDNQTISISMSTSGASSLATSNSNSTGKSKRWHARDNKLSLRKFDKRLSARHNQSKRSNYPIWYHSFLLTHRTWLSIVRDPIFFGIQFTMHTTIPILLALIFGSTQDEGCPQVGNFDLVEFAYQPNQADFIQSTMRSIRQSIGNIGIIFFEMFVLSFAINCITALVFPLDMYVLLKEYRNGWYSLRSYFFGRTLADLPVPIVLHSMAMTILYYLTGQPFTWWRFGSIIGIVILASLVAQSVGLTIGALLMRSSQSAVLAAAGIVAPFFALSGFIVRIHTLPWVAQFFAKGSYLYHLLNGFIILRYGFDRCSCKDEDFERVESHKIPNNLRTMASIWIGTYSNEFESSNVEQLSASNNNQMALPAVITNRTNLDPNIDIIDKLMGAFKMANSFGHKVETCADVMPYAMLDFNLKDSDILWSCLALLLMLIISRFITFSAIYYKVRSYS